MNTLVHLYDIGGKIYGIKGGYKGFYHPETPPIELTPKLVQDIHRQGGTFLGSSRGGFDIDKIMAFIEDKKINQLYVIGGDGTHRGAFLVHEACMAKVGKKYCIIHTGKQKQNSFPLFFFSSSWFNRRVSMFQWQVYQKQ